VASEPTEIMFTSGKQTQFLDYLPSPVLSLVATTTFCAAGMQDGSVNVYSHTGRRFVIIFKMTILLVDGEWYRVMPTLSLGSPCAFMDGNKNSLMVVTASGQLYSW
jgi:protein HIRA/HIR1